MEFLEENEELMWVEVRGFRRSVASPTPRQQGDKALLETSGVEVAPYSVVQGSAGQSQPGVVRS